MKPKPPLSREYVEFVAELKQRIVSARLHAARAVNQDLILLYWDIGRGIVERQEKLGWGQSVVEMLSRELKKAFPGLTGFSAANLWRVRQFYAEYSAETFLAQVAREVLSAIPWWHHVGRRVAFRCAWVWSKFAARNCSGLKWPQVLADLIKRIENQDTERFLR